MSDLPGKYQKLATEYSKLRAQIPVLKKAVIEEQGKAEELKDSIKSKDQSIRKYEQEIDSLSFRNQQLSKRVLVLQDELEESQSKGKKGKHKNSDPPPMGFPADTSVIGQELQSKIEENARLHKQVYESDQEYKQVVDELRDRQSILERETSTHQEVIRSMVEKHKSTVDKLQEEKAMLEVKYQAQDKEVRECKLRAELAEQRLEQVQRELQTKLGVASKIIRDKLPFNDTLNRDLNSLNIPTHDRKHQLRARELINNAAGHIRELTQGLSNWHTYTEQRTKIYPSDEANEPLSDVNKKLSTFLHENASYLRALEAAFHQFHESLRDDALTTLETSVGLQNFSDKFRCYVNYVSKLHPYQLLSLEEECAVASCTSTLKAKNMELHSALQRFMAALNKLETHTALIAAQSKKGCHHPKSNQGKMFALLTASLHGFHEALREVSKHYNSKVSLEHQLPTATQKLKTTDECVVSSLVSLVTTTGRFSTFLESNLDFFSTMAGYRTRGSSISTNESEEGPKSNPVVSLFRQRAANYIQLISRPCPESVPYKTALQNRRILLSSTESRDSLAQQVTSLHDKVCKLEQDKEHWLLESQLLQIKYEKELKRVGDLEQQLQRLQRSMTGSIEDNLHIDSTAEQRNKSLSVSSTSIDPTIIGTLVKEGIEDDDVQTREELIKNHYTARITSLTNQLQVAESKAVNFHAECRALHKRLSAAEKSKSVNLTDLDSTTQEVSQLKDELQTTKRSYESQLSLMSEHIAGLNDKLTTQKDEIDALKLLLNSHSKGSRNLKRK
ncbi:protein phosphatase 1 regulatory subunit 21-like [Tubulanus polymorphus]|uniref:protein phosphatase 1 regulatory subunit 21-like n=1 Tax=Tubulanus polymorphus TaxID=672921 RepID=UPI003DA4F13D